MRPTVMAEHRIPNRDDNCQLGNFLKHQNSVLNGTALEIHNVSKPSVCAYHCVDHEHCVSCNVAAAPDRNGNYECQLLAVDRFSQPSGFRQNQEFTHYSKHVRLCAPLGNSIILAADSSNIEWLSFIVILSVSAELMHFVFYHNVLLMIFLESLRVQPLQERGSLSYGIQQEYLHMSL